MRGAIALSVIAALIAAFFINPLFATAANTGSIHLERNLTQYLEAPDSPSLSITNNMTIETWVKFEELPPQTGQTSTRFASHWDSSVNQKGFLWSLRNQDGVYLLDFANSSNGTSDSLVEVAWTPNTGVWYHVAVTFQSGVVKFYVDGVQQGSDQTSAMPTIKDSTSNFNVGSVQGPNDLLTGNFDDMRLWNTVRTQSEIALNRSRELAGTTSNLVAYWKFNNDYTDSTANGNTLTAINSPILSSDIAFVSDETPPSVSITNPVESQSVSGTIALTASSTDNVALAGVQFMINGSNFGVEDTSAAYSVNIDTTTLANGTHTVSAVARDTSDNTASSTVVSFTVNNTAPFVPVLKVRKTANESVISSSTVQADDHLKLSLEGGKTYILDGIIFASAVNGTPDIKINFGGSGVTTATIGYTNEQSQGVLANNGTSPNIQLTATPEGIHIKGTVVTNADGDFELKWAQNTSNANATSVLLGSYLRAEEI